MPDDGCHGAPARPADPFAAPGATVTLRQLAERAGVTESFLSQVEREVTSPSIASVQRIARALDLGIAELFVDEPPLGRVVRRSERRRIVYPGLRAVDEFLTIGRDGRLQVIVSTIEPGGGTATRPTPTSRTRRSSSSSRARSSSGSATSSIS